MTDKIIDCDRLPPRVRQLLDRAYAAKYHGREVTLAFPDATHRGAVEYVELDPGRKNDFIKVQIKIALPRGERV